MTLPPHVIEAGLSAAKNARAEAIEATAGISYPSAELAERDVDEYSRRIISATIHAALAALWQPIESAPKDRPIVLWHKVWDCEVTAQHRADDLAEIGLDAELCWLEKTKTTAWPADAFTHWRESLPLPQEGKSD